MGSCGGLQIDCLLNFCLCEAVFLPGGKTMQSLQSLARARTHAPTHAEGTRRSHSAVVTGASACNFCVRVWIVCGVRGHSPRPLAFFCVALYRA